MSHRLFVAFVVGSTLLAAGGRSSASVAEDLSAAAAAGRPVFLIVKDASVGSLDLARKVAGEAQQMVPGSMVIEMDRGAAENAALVAQHRLSSAPVPLVLVLAPNGVAVGGARPHQVTAGKLARMVPTRGKAAHLKALAEGRADFVVFARASMTYRAEVLAACEQAVARLGGKAAVVAVDLDDASEAAFRDEMKVDPKAKAVVVKVFNAKGKATDTFHGAVAVEALVAAATKEGDCGCGPEGCK